MSDDNGNGKNGKFDWRVVIISVALVMGQGLIQWGITSATLAEHTRRIELIEHDMRERSIDRGEYERRHEDLRNEMKDLKLQVDQNRKDIQDIERGRK